VGSCVSGSAHKITDVIAGNILTGVANAGCVSRTEISGETCANKLTRLDCLHLLHPRNHPE
jgi:hypothetical protein